MHMDSAAAAATAPQIPAGPRHGSGSIGPFFAVISVVIVLTVMSCIVGRIWAAQAEGPDTRYDCMAWARRRCWRSTLGRRSIVQEAKAAVAAEELDAKAGKGDHAALPMPQP